MRLSRKDVTVLTDASRLCSYSDVKSEGKNHGTVRNGGVADGP